MSSSKIPSNFQCRLIVSVYMMSVIAALNICYAKARYDYRESTIIT